jgi:guanine deaminase
MARFRAGTRMDYSFLKQTIDLAVESVRRGGGPFAALVVKDGAAIGVGTNQVTRSNDPTAHAEIVAIREACRALGSFQIAGCDVYSSCEPCPMCLGAIYWARPAHVYFAATRDDACAAGFDDSEIYRQISLPNAERSIPMVHVPDQGAARPFQEWAAKPDKLRY